jgi:hypothetical protein
MAIGNLVRTAGRSRRWCVAAVLTALVASVASAPAAGAAPLHFFGAGTVGPTGPRQHPRVASVITQLQAVSYDLITGVQGPVAQPDSLTTTSGTDGSTGLPEVGLSGIYNGLPTGSDFRLTLDVPGGQHLVPGTVYSSNTTGMQVAFPTSEGFSTGCSIGPSTPPGTAFGEVIVDQVTYGSGPTPTSIALRLGIICPTLTTAGSSFQPALSGTVGVGVGLSTPGQGYYVYDFAGGLAGLGNDSYLNYLGTPIELNLNQPVVSMAITPDEGGYWMVAADGGVFAYGDAPFYGSTGNLTLNKPIVGMAATPDGKGYWFVAADGGIFAYGDAGFYGSTGNLVLNQPIVGMAATPDGKGYWLVAADGGIFAFGDAQFYGSTGNLVLNQPIVGMATTPDGKGYWLVAADGGIFAYGDAPFYGSTGNLVLNQPIVGMAATHDGRGYWFVAADGGVFSFGDAPFEGSLAGSGITGVTGMVVAPGTD